MAKTVSINVNINTKKAITSIADLNNEIGDTIVTVSDLRMTVDTLQQELEATEVGTDRWNELRMALIDANTELKNYELGIEALDNEQVASEMKSVVGGLTDMAGGFVLVGASGKKMEELVQIFAQVEGASRIVTGAMEGYNSMMKLQNVISLRAVALRESLTAATLGQGVAAKVASVGVGILNAVMNLNPVFLLITGLTALIAGLAIFFSSTNEAAEAQEKLNLAMENQNRMLELNSKIRSQNNNLIDAQTDATSKLLEKELELLKANEDLTDQQKERIREIEFELDKLELQNFTDKAKRAGEDIADFSSQAVGDFNQIIGAIKATEEEDGIDNINYESLESQVVRLRKEFSNVSAAFSRTGDVDAYNAALANLITKSGNLEGKLKNLNRELDSAEQEPFAEAITEAGNLSDKLVEIRGKVIEVGEANIEYNTAIDLQMQNRELKNQEMLQKKREEAEKKRQDRWKKFQERRKELLTLINEELQRRFNADRKNAQQSISLIEDEFEQQRELAEFTYGTQREDLIRGAIKREEAALGEKFVKGKISEQEYRDGIEEINKNGIDNLLEEEVRLLETKKKILDQSLEDIKKAEEQELLLKKKTIEDVDVVRLERQKTELQMLKEQAQFVAKQTITDETKLQERLLEINKFFLDREVQQVRDTEKELIDARTAQYKADLQAAEDNVEEKKLLEEEYNRDIVQINADAQSEIVGLYEGTQEAVKESTFVLTEQQQLIFDTVVNGIQQSLQIINDALAESAERAAYEREANFAAEAEGLNQLLANKTISQEQFDAKSRELEQKKQVEETKAKRKQFKIDKANNIIQAVISTAQAVLQGLAAGPPPVGPILAAINGALGAAQIGVISAQQFRAARGGVVPGSPSNVDSVSALLAPGEMVINSTSAGMFGNLLSAVNQAGGGIPLTPSAPPTEVRPPAPTFRDNAQQSVVRAYVVETDVTQKQEKVSRIQRSSEF